MLDVIGLILAAIGAILIVSMYVRNMWVVVLAFRKAEYSLFLISRIIGIFFPLWGVVMGMV